MPDGCCNISQSHAGSTTTSSKAVWQAPLHYRGIQALMNSVHPETEANSGLTSRFNVKLPLSVEVQQDLQWWVSLNQTAPLQAPLLPQIPNMTITSDASNTGWGACLGDTTTRGLVSTGDEAPHQLSQTLSGISSSVMLFEGNKQHDRPSQIGQCDSSHFHQSDGRNSLQAFVPTSTCLVGMVHSHEPVPSCRKSTRSTESSCIVA